MPTKIYCARALSLLRVRVLELHCDGYRLWQATAVETMLRKCPVRLRSDVMVRLRAAFTSANIYYRARPGLSRTYIH